MCEKRREQLQQQQRQPEQQPKPPQQPGIFGIFRSERNQMLKSAGSMSGIHPEYAHTLFNNIDGEGGSLVQTQEITIDQIKLENCFEDWQRIEDGLHISRNIKEEPEDQAEEQRQPENPQHAGIFGIFGSEQNQMLQCAGSMSGIHPENAQIMFNNIGGEGGSQANSQEVEINQLVAFLKTPKFVTACIQQLKAQEEYIIVVIDAVENGNMVNREELLDSLTSHLEVTRERIQSLDKIFIESVNISGSNQNKMYQNLIKFHLQAHIGYIRTAITSIGFVKNSNERQQNTGNMRTLKKNFNTLIKQLKAQIASIHSLLELARI